MERERVSVKGEMERECAYLGVRWKDKEGEMERRGRENGKGRKIVNKVLG